MTDDDEEHGANSASTVPPPKGETSSYEAKTKVGGLSDEALQRLLLIDSERVSQAPAETTPSPGGPDAPRKVRKIVLGRPAEGGHPPSPPEVLISEPRAASPGDTPPGDAAPEPAPDTSAVASAVTDAAPVPPVKRRSFARVFFLAGLVLVAAAVIVIVRAGGVSRVQILHSYPWVQLNE